MNFRKFLEMTDKWAASEQAHKAATARIRATGAFADLLPFQLMVYTDEELRELGHAPGKWVGQYSKGSIDSGKGATVLLNIDRHNDGIGTLARGMTDTILHEMGHALWELLDAQSQQAWNQNQRGHKWGPEEAFADDFMYFCNGETHQMNNEELFLQLTSHGQPQPNSNQKPPQNVSPPAGQSVGIRNIQRRGT